jgi:hypothetical protein
MHRHDDGELGTHLAALTVLKRLELLAKNIDVDSATALSPHLAALVASRLPSLDLSSNGIGGEGAAAVGTHLAGIVTPQCLNLALHPRLRAPTHGAHLEAKNCFRC